MATLSRLETGYQPYWQAWLHFVKFRKAHGDFRKAGRQARSAWFQGRLDELQQHAHKKDARSLFQGVRALAPKTRHTAVQLRSAEGHILSPFQQAEILTTHYRKIYTRTLPDPDREMRMPPLQLDVPELRAALDALKAHKAVPAHLAPVAIWKLCSAELVPHLQRIANNFVAAPDLWHAAWWALLPKITKPTLPKHLRPIGLSEVSSRVIGKVLQCRLRPYVEAYLRDLPQWAYTPGRGTLDAALRVQAHCQQVMQECQPNRWTVREARAGLPRPLHQVGGLQLSLDLSAAFDTLEWCHIADALRDADIPMELQAHIMEWHRNIKYHLEIQGQHIEIAASRGIKQGCLVAPLVWSLVTGGFLYLLALETDPLWVAQDVTAYADDFHAGSRVTNIRGLQSLLFRLGSLLDILAQAGLNVNALKSAILYRFKGTFARTWLRQHIRTTPDGDLFRLRTPAGALYEFPVVSTHTYLGTRISYHDPRVQTLRHRMQLAQVEWSRLRKLVCSKRGLYSEDRIRVWRSSVPATLLYGLAASGLPTGGLAAVRAVYMRQLRAIMRCPCSPQ